MLPKMIQLVTETLGLADQSVPYFGSRIALQAKKLPSVSVPFGGEVALILNGEKAAPSL
jgi:hypothetical protein